MRICYVTSHAHGYDGWGRYTVEVVRGARERGVEPVLVTAHPELDPTLEGVEQHVILPPFFQGRFETLRSLAAAPRLRPIIAGCDLVHCTVELYAPLVALAHPRAIPYVQNAHGTWAVRPLESPARRAIFASAFRHADRLLVLSHYTQDRMAEHIRLPDHEVLTGGVNPADYAQPVAVALPEWASNARIVLSVGGVKARKGQHVALKAVGIARRQFPDLHYVVIGDASLSDSYVKDLQHWADELGMADAFHLRGRVPFDEMVAWYQRADVFMLLPVNQGSSIEGLGLVYLEAGAAGTPSIGTQDCGAVEAIADGETGFVVPQNDPPAAASALARLLGDDTLRARMGAAARARADALSWDHLVGRLLAIYGELVA